MSVGRRGGLAASGVLLSLGYAALSGLLVWGTRGPLSAVRAPGPASLDALVALAAASAAWVVLSWLSGATVLLLVSSAWAGAGSRLSQRAARLAPAVSRRLVAAVLGASVGGLPLTAVAPARAEERPATVVAASRVADHRAHPPRAPQPTAGTMAGALDRPAVDVPLGWQPDRPAAAPRRVSPDEAGLVRLVATAARPERSAADELVVRRGDSLWSIAERFLGPDASAAEIAAEWPRWYAANRTAIGADPNLLHPGQRLVPPT